MSSVAQLPASVPLTPCFRQVHKALGVIKDNGIHFFPDRAEFCLVDAAALRSCKNQGGQSGQRTLPVIVYSPLGPHQLELFFPARVPPQFGHNA